MSDSKDTEPFVARAIDMLKTPDKAVKHDSSKPRTDLLPFKALGATAEVFAFGAVKYADDNWRNGMKLRRLLGAGLRHAFAWGSGEDLDPESKLPHLAHACCCFLMLLESVLEGYGEDDRWKRG